MKINTATRPAIKRSYNASLTKEGKIIVGVTPDDCVEIEVNAPWVSGLLCMLDGGKSVLDIASALKQRGFDVSTQDVLEQLQLLAGAGVLEDSDDYNRAVASNMLDDHAIERFDRQMLLFQTVLGSYVPAFECQKKLKEAKIALIGLGGVGSYAFYGLAAMGFGYIRAVEFDTIELTNLSRQILYEEGDVGRSKVSVAKVKGPRINSRCTFEFIEEMVSDVEKCESVLRGMDLAIIVADIPRGKIWNMVNEAAHKTGTPVLYGGSAQTWGVIGPLVVPGKTPCYDCCKPEQLLSDHPVVEFVRARYTTALIDPYNAIGASFLVLEAVKFITNFQACQVLGQVVLMDLGNYKTYSVSGSRQPHCQYCGVSASATQCE